jgi:RNA polymerase sigma-70 factor (ECF subfamily)
VNDDGQIIAAVLSGNAAAFEGLVQKYKAYVFKIASHMVPSPEVDEVAHEAFIRAYKDLGSYRQQAPFQHWLSRVTERTCYDHWRRVRRQRVVAVAEEELKALVLEADLAKQSEEAAVKRARESLDWALGHLDPVGRLAFSMLYLENMSMPQVGEALGWSVAKLTIRSFRARHALKKLLKTELGT